MKFTRQATLTAAINKHPLGTTVLVDDPEGGFPVTIMLPDKSLTWAYERELENIECLPSAATPIRSD